MSKTFQIEPFHDVYLFVNNKVPHRAKRGAHAHTEKLKNHESVSIYELK